MIVAAKGALKLEQVQPSHRFVLVVLALYANENALTWPSIARVVANTGLNHKTVSSAIRTLREKQLIIDTGKRVGPTRRVAVFRIADIVIDQGNQDDQSQYSGDIDQSGEPEITISESGNISTSNVAMSPKTDANVSTNRQNTSPLLDTLKSGESTGKKTESKQLRARTIPFPDSWKPTNDDREYAQKLGVNLNLEAERFAVFYREGKGAGKRGDWSERWKNWCLKAVEFGHTGKPDPSQTGLFAPSGSGDNTVAALGWVNCDGVLATTQEALDTMRLNAGHDAWQFVRGVSTSGDPWCAANKAAIYRLGRWAAEEALKSYREYRVVIDRLMADISTTHDVHREARIEMFKAAVRARWEELRRAEAEKAALLKAVTNAT